MRWTKDEKQGKFQTLPAATAGKPDDRSWRINRQVNVSVLIQLAFLASLIIGSWVNLQRQLDLLQHDVKILLACQKNFEQKLESLQAKSISYEYRLRAVEKDLSQVAQPQFKEQVR